MRIPEALFSQSFGGVLAARGTFYKGSITATWYLYRGRVVVISDHDDILFRGHVAAIPEVGDFPNTGWRRLALGSRQLRVALGLF